MSRQLGVRGENLIKSFESLRLTAYKDGGGVWTIGWGHTGPEVVRGLVWTYAQAEAAFVEDTAEAISAVNASLHAEVTQNQFDALVSFTFNIGIGAEAHSTLLRLINAGEAFAAAAEFPKWCHDNGVEIAGLKRRRVAEQTLFLSDDAATSVPT